VTDVFLPGHTFLRLNIFSRILSKLFIFPSFLWPFQDQGNYVYHKLRHYTNSIVPQQHSHVHLTVLTTSTTCLSIQYSLNDFSLRNTLWYQLTRHRQCRFSLKGRANSQAATHWPLTAEVWGRSPFEFFGILMSVSTHQCFAPTSLNTTLIRRRSG